jgi:hypothetical protein
MMVLVLVIGVGLAWLIHDGRRKAEVHREAVRAIESAGGFVWYDWEWANGKPVRRAKPPRPGWLVRFLGRDAHGTLVCVDLPDECKSDEIMVHVGQLSGLEELDASIWTSRDDSEKGDITLNSSDALRVGCVDKVLCPPFLVQSTSVPDALARAR